MANPALTNPAMPFIQSDSLAIKLVKLVHQMSNFKAKMHQIRFRSAPDPAGGAYSVPDPLALFKGPTSKGMKGKGRGREGEGKREGK